LRSLAHSIVTAVLVGAYAVVYLVLAAHSQGWLTLDGQAREPANPFVAIVAFGPSAYAGRRRPYHWPGVSRITSGWATSTST
jgi:hypothetical protein